ncbi:arginase family protein [Stenotrophomonas maltophilia]|uniref:arginase family protein n=1 Tax=Stenotrophomonas maltophilia TaxID=40324 RepID=UPI0034DB0274
MNLPDNQTLRLHFPQWQGGNNPPYHLGAQLLAWLAPQSSGPMEEVFVPVPDGTALEKENGIVARGALIQQQREARRLIDKHKPDRLVVLGGDCLVDLAPFAYLNERYGGDLAVLWVDSHPDISTPEQLPTAHAMVLASLMGHADPEFAAEVAVPVKPANVLYVGVHDPNAWEAKEMDRLGLCNVSPEQLAEQGSAPVLDWLRSTGARHVAVHFDLDVLETSGFRAQLMANPSGLSPFLQGVAQGELSMAQVISVLRDVAEVADVVGLGIAEHLPWDAINLKRMLEQLPLISTPPRRG